MNKVLTACKNWMRGYSDEDVSSARAKMALPKYPGEITWVSDKEYKAIVRGAAA